MQKSQPRFALLLATHGLLFGSGVHALAQTQPTAMNESGGQGLSALRQLPWPASAAAAAADSDSDSDSARGTLTDAAGPLPFAAQPSAAPPNAHLGNRLLANAVRQISQHRSIAANIRHRIHLFGHELVGSGTYQQVDIGPDRLLRLELKIPLDDQITSVIQICDARFVWLQRTMPDGRGGQQTEISRIDLNRVRRVTGGDLGEVGVRRNGLLLGQGGLPQLMIELDQHFAFHEVRAATLHNVPVWITWGEWKPEKLAKLFPPEETGDQSAAERDARWLANLPRHVPHMATVVLGRDDLLPYQFEYRRRTNTADARDGLTVLDNTMTQPIVTMELYDVEVGGVIDATQFTFNADDYVDKTREYLMHSTQAN